MHDATLLLLDSDVHSRLEWELAIFGAFVTVGIPLAISIARWLWRRGNSNRLAIRKLIQDMAQLRDAWVEKFRNGVPFPPHPKLPEDIDREFKD